MTDTKNMILRALPSDPVRGAIMKLREEQDAVRARKKELTRAMKNEKRKQTRLRKRARQMTDEDLVAALMMRKDAQAGSRASAVSAAGTTTPPARRPRTEPSAGPDLEAPTPPPASPTRDDREVSEERDLRSE
jgi:hypothetical protein